MKELLFILIIIFILFVAYGRRPPGEVSTALPRAEPIVANTVVEKPFHPKAPDFARVSEAPMSGRRGVRFNDVRMERLYDTGTGQIVGNQTGAT